MSLVISTTWKDADLSMMQGCLDFNVAVRHHKVFIRTFILRPFLKVTKLSRQTACSSLSSQKPNCEQGELPQIKTLHEIREWQCGIGVEEVKLNLIISQAYLKVGVVVHHQLGLPCCCMEIQNIYFTLHYSFREQIHKNYFQVLFVLFYLFTGYNCSLDVHLQMLENND